MEQDGGNRIEGSERWQRRQTRVGMPMTGGSRWFCAWEKSRLGFVVQEPWSSLKARRPFPGNARPLSEP